MYYIYIMKKIGENIKKIRLLKNMGQKEIYGLLDIKQPSYNNYENGKTDISVSRLYQLAKILDVSIFELLGEDKPQADYSQCPNCKNKEIVINNLNDLVARQRTELDFLKDTYKLQKSLHHIYGTDSNEALQIVAGGNQKHFPTKTKNKK